MASRTYDTTRRLQQQAQRRQRVAEATAELHAERGVGGTGYADIAQRAGVSLPSVHSYFPTQDDMLRACTSHVAAGAPALPTADILAEGDLPAAAARLVDGVDRLHAYFEPWARWRDERTVPFLARLAAERSERSRRILKQLLARHIDPVPANQARVWEALLSFDLWHRLVRQHGLPRAHVRSLLTHLLLCALDAPRRSPPHPRSPS